MIQKDIYAQSIERPINGVIKADSKAELENEIKEYVITAEPQQPKYLIWTMVFCGLNFITSTINHFKDKETHSALFNTAYTIFIIAWVLTLILMVVTLLLKPKCSITESGIVVSSGRTIAPSTCWYELEGKKLIITDRKTNYKCTYTVTGDMEKLNEILKASYTRHA